MAHAQLPIARARPRAGEIMRRDACIDIVTTPMEVKPPRGSRA